MNARRLNRSEIRRIRVGGGYVLNVDRSGARIHRANCITVMWMNPDKRPGVYYTATLNEALRWLESKSMRGVPCRRCLPTLSYRPRPEKLMIHLN